MPAQHQARHGPVLGRPRARAVGRCEELMDEPGNYGIHLDYIALREESLGSALTRVRRSALKTTTGTSRRPWQGNARARSLRMREERIARLLDDPEKLRELRQQRAERKAGKQQSKGRHMSMRM